MALLMLPLRSSHSYHNGIGDDKSYQDRQRLHWQYFHTQFH